MKQAFLVICLITIPFIKIFTQETYIKNRLSFKLGNAQYKSPLSDGTFRTYAIPKLEANYGINKYAELGIYTGFNWESSQSVMPNIYWNYGINANFHILPFFIKQADSRFDLYISGKLGGIRPLGENTYNPYHPLWSDYGIYGGVVFYPLDHIGAFIEYGKGSFTRFRYGISIKL